jgi:hypothetical protein
MQEQQQQNLLLLIEQIQQQQAGDRAPASMLTHQSTVEGGIGAGGDAGNHAGRRKQDDDDDEVGSVSYATKQARRGQALGYNGLQMLRGSPRTPSIVGRFPETWSSLLGNWKNNDYESFVNMNPRLWDNSALTQRFVKRHRAIKMLRKFKQKYNCHDDIEAAGKLDEMLLSILKISLTKHVNQLFESDGMVKRREKKRKNNDNDNNND